MSAKVGIWVISGPASFFMQCTALRKNPKQCVIPAAADATEDKLPPHLFQCKGAWDEKCGVTLGGLKSNLSLNSFANLLSPSPHRVLKDHRLVFFKVPAQDVGRERARRAVCQAEPASLHHLHRCQHCGGTAGAGPLTRDGQDRAPFAVWPWGHPGFLL